MKKNKKKTLKFSSFDRTIDLLRLSKKLNYNMSKIKMVNKSSKNFLNLGRQQKARTWYPLRDFDKDGLINAADCNVFNKKKQDVEPNAYMRNRLKNLNVYVTPQKMSYAAHSPEEHAAKGENAWHIMSPQAKKYAYNERQRALSAIKHYPHIVDRIEKTQPESVVLTSDSYGPERKNYSVAGAAHADEYYLMNNETGEKSEQYYKTNIVVKVPMNRQNKQFDIPKQHPEWSEKYMRASTARTAFHELEHARQQKEWSKQRLLKDSKMKYDERPSEIQAEKKSWKDVNAPYKVASKQQITKGIEYVTDENNISNEKEDILGEDDIL